MWESSSATITNNTITGNGFDGLVIGHSAVTVTGNIISGNNPAGAGFSSAGNDIYLNTGATGNISHNVFDAIEGPGIVGGSYNVTSDGNPITVP